MTKHECLRHFQAIFDLLGVSEVVPQHGSSVRNHGHGNAKIVLRLQQRQPQTSTV